MYIINYSSVNLIYDEKMRSLFFSSFFFPSLVTISFELFEPHSFSHFYQPGGPIKTNFLYSINWLKYLWRCDLGTQVSNTTLSHAKSPSPLPLRCKTMDEFPVRLPILFGREGVGSEVGVWDVELVWVVRAVKGREIAILNSYLGPG